MRTRTVFLIAFATLAVVLGGTAFWFSDRLATSTYQPPAQKLVASTEPDQAVVARAAAGDPNAQLQMGNWVLEKALHPADYREAAEWLGKAAASGNAEAEYRLGALFQSGRVPDEGGTNALVWLQKAAAQRHATALYTLGLMYGMGQGVARDSATAVRYLRQAAELGNAYAQFNLGRRYAEGQGIPTNLVEAWQWFALAESGGIASAQEPKRAVEARLTTAELEQGRRAAEETRKQLPAVNK